METRTILVTGGAGFIGSWLVDELVRRGHQVISADNLLGGKERNINPDCKFVKADLRRRNEVSSVVKGVEIIFHLAAYAAEGQSIFSPISINEINIAPMNNLLVEAVNNEVERFVFTSSMAVYGNQTPPFNEDLPRRPEDPYGAAKSYCETVLEIFARTYDFEYVILRPHNVYGPRQNVADPYRNVLGIWINRIMRGKPPLIYGDGEQTRAFSYIEDVSAPIANSGFFDEARGQTINIGSNEITRVKDACKIVLELTGSNLTPQYENTRPAEVKHAYSTVDKSMKVLGYKTNHTLREGLVRMIEWARKLGPEEPTYTFPLEITKKAPRVWVEKLM
jgi:UDP-glucose 4-epimerase